MQPPLTSILGAVFVLLAVVNCYLMLRTHRNSIPAGRGARARAHRLIGYLFTFIYVVMMYHMILRLKGLHDEISPRSVIHASLALLLAPLLFAKIVVARNYKRENKVLTILGLSIAGISYLLVIINLGAYWLRSASPATVPSFISMPAIGVCAAAILVLLWRRSRRAGTLIGLDSLDPSKSRTSSVVLQLVRIQRQTHHAKTLRFLVPREYYLSFRPGQFLNFRWNIDGRVLSRCYSICSSPLQTGYIEITPKQAANGCVSVFLNQKASIGLAVEASTPAGQFCFDEAEDRRIVLIAGGSGITPFMSMLRYIDDRSLPTEATLLYFVRTRKDIMFYVDLEFLQSRLSNFHMLTVLSQPDPGWIGLTGHFTRDLIDINVEQIPSSTFFLCGPPAMMKSARDVLEAMHVSPTKIKQESFGAAAANASLPHDPVIQTVSVEFARSNQRRMASSLATLLDTAETCGIRIPYSCRQGVCGTCATKLLTGPCHMDREDGLSPELKQRGYILPCVTRAYGDVRIDA